ncbi:Stk1 family PASTA domain-containing Ser/Thr kinase [Cohnella hashimotonis]|uniref:non-specific serine/threonine protein kinase n=1 Tax=Cohnella hashimotonis TaxID=2826895 RepID=A0ABT6THX7_9BACL|nr:Stk1 family PASTA domain-containing Ser/Thr kinase [Cohnella hashimotonis]MDI4646410.1 Stk1 family PASTA domain-containing Ser/Thr kinase [Cohnella hashimotonis]
MTAIGHLLGGRYELLSRVGGGGMALVYKARDILLNRFVAVKVLRQQFMHDDEFVRRFRREAQSAAALSHPNIVSIYDVGQEEDTHYIVMEYIDGANLNEIIRERAPLAVNESVRIASQICDALDHAHQSQIIHRDIKPHNILIGTNGRVKVTDFGIARAATSSTITQTGSVVGSVHYFSPEHAKGVATGEKSDIYSLGIVLYQMLTGRLPFLGESPISVALKHLQEPFEDPRLVNPSIPQSVENVILRAMRKNPLERYASAQDMLDDLATCLQPQRLNEPKVRFPSDADEEEQTRVIPAIRPEMRSSGEETLAGKGSRKNGPPEERQTREGAAEKRKRKKWVLPVIFGVIAAILIAILIWAIFALKGQLVSPDVQVPTVVNKTLEVATAELEKAGLKVADPVLYEQSETVDKDLVIRQSKQDMPVKSGSLITLTVSLGKELPTLDDYTGKLYEDAVEALQAQGAKNVDKVEKFNDEAPAGTVLSQSPAPGGTYDPEKDTITLNVSKGPESFPMPNLIGMSLSEARAELTKSNLSLPNDKVLQEPSYTTKGKVFKQFPAEQNELVTPGTEVTIWISSGYPADAKEKTWNVTVSPAVEGQTSTVKILLTDARGDSEWGTKKIKTTQTFPIKLVVSPDKEGQITVYRDDQFLDRIRVPYADVEQTPDPTPTPPEETPTPPVDTPADGTIEQPTNDGSNPPGDDPGNENTSVGAANGKANGKGPEKDKGNGEDNGKGRANP